ELARRHKAWVVVDETHATGVVGPAERELVAELGLENEVDVMVDTLSKTLSSYGAFACCAHEIAELLVNRARTLIFSTGLPPACVAAALAALDVLRTTPELVDRLHANARLLRNELSSDGFDVWPTDMPIVPLILGDPHEALALSEAALRDGVFAQAIRPPT